MPTGTILPTDPNNMLSSLLYAPSAGPTSTPEMDEYADRGAKEAILHYLATGQTPTSEHVYATGPIQALGQTLGLAPTSQPLPQSVIDRAQLAKKLQTQQDQARTIEQKLVEMQAINPLAQQFGGKFAHAAMQQIDPSMAGAFTPDLVGKGEVAQEKTQMQADYQSRIADIRAALAAGQIDRAQALTAIANERAGISQQQADTALSRMQLQREQYENAPMRAAQTEHLASLDRREGSLISEIAKLGGDPSVDPNSPILKQLNDQLQRIQNERDGLYNEMMGGGSSTRKPLPSRMPKTTVTGGDTSSPTPTPSGPAPIRRGLFD